MTKEKRSLLISILSGTRHIMLTSHGCGIRSQLGFRLTLDKDSVSSVYSRDGEHLSGPILSDQELTTFARRIIGELQELLH